MEITKKPDGMSPQKFNSNVSKILKKTPARGSTGLHVGAHRDGKVPMSILLFGCKVCAWIGTVQCPHGIKIGETHANKICQARYSYLQDEYERVGTATRLIQNEEAVKLKMICDRMLSEYADQGELNGEYKHISKNLITILDKMRKQDEGVKIHAEVSTDHISFREMVEVEAKKIEERDNKTRPGEFTEEVQDSRRET